MKEFEISSAFVTGANRGIGLAIVAELLQLPTIRFVFAGYRSKGATRELDELSAKFPGVLHAVQIDVTSDESVKCAEKRVEELLDASRKKLDLLINNAGFYGGRLNIPGNDLLNPKMTAILPHFEVNACGPILTTAAFLPLLTGKSGDAPFVDRRAVVINISSLLGSIARCNGGSFKVGDGGVVQSPNIGGYGMSKAALNWYTKALSCDVPEIVCVAIHPGWVRTDMGGTDAPTCPSKTAAWIVQKALEIGPKETGTFFDVNGTLPY